MAVCKSFDRLTSEVSHSPYPCCRSIHLPPRTLPYLTPFATCSGIYRRTHLRSSAPKLLASRSGVSLAPPVALGLAGTILPLREFILCMATRSLAAHRQHTHTSSACRSRLRLPYRRYQTDFCLSSLTSIDIPLPRPLSFWNCSANSLAYFRLGNVSIPASETLPLPPFAGGHDSC